jgi:hypothetical protein
MESNQRTAPNFLHKGQGKDKHFQAQMKRVFTQFQNTEQGFTLPTPNCSRLLLNLQKQLSYETKPRI